MKPIARACAAAVVGAALFAGCTGGSGHPQGPPPIQVATYTVHQGETMQHDVYPATVVALNQVELRPEVSGYISEIDFKDGQRVTKGMKLYGIDQRQYQAAYDQATANLSVAKANLVKVQQDVDRYQQLARQNAVARQTLEHAVADLQSGKMQVAAAEANVKSVQTNLRYSVITAPFHGTIGISQVKRGSAVAAGQTLLNILSSDDPMAVDCAVDEKEIGRFTQLLHEKVPAKDSTFTLQMPDGTFYPFLGRLSLLDRAVDAETGTIRIRLIFPNPDGLLRPGLTCNVLVRTPGHPGELLIPYRAVVEQMGEYFVFVVHGNRVAERRLTLGPQSGGMVAVLDGLSAGDQIVSDGVQRLHDNAMVAFAPPSGSGTPGYGQSQHERQESR